MNRLHRIALSVLLLAPFGVAAAPSPDLNALLDGVQTIAAPGVPGTVAAFGPQAFVVCEGPHAAGAAPVVAAAHFGEGRVVIFGHDGFLSPDSAVADTARLLSNIIRWAGAKQGDRVRVGLVGPTSLAVILAQQGLQGGVLTKANWRTSLANFDVLVLEPGYLRESDAAPMQAFVKAGGGLVMGATGWGWESLNHGKSLGTDFPANRVIEPFGLAWTGGWIRVDATKLLTPSHDPDPLLHADNAIKRLLQPEPGDTELLQGKKAKGKPGGTPLAQAGDTLLQLAKAAGPTNPIVIKLHELDGQPQYTKLPSEKHPLKSTDGIARVLLVMHLLRWDVVPGEKVTASPAADEFPGKVPAQAPRVSQSVEIDTSVPRWHSTGLYAAPGEGVTIDLPEAAIKKGLRVQIGCHTDDLFDLDQWLRVPRIVTSMPLNDARTQITSRFGGPVYIVVPDKDNSPHIQAKSASAAMLGVLPVKISGAIEMPLFVLGKTTLAQWKQSIRSRPAPWAELASDKIILTFKSDPVRTLDDPEAVLRHWDRVQDANAKLAQLPTSRPCPMRFVTDLQISAGYMHSGYPIMTWLDVTKTFIDVAKLKTVNGGWGFYHELGHNHQRSDWTFDGTGEVTVNLFTMHTLETVCGASPQESTRRALEPAARLTKYLAHPDFEEWKKDSFLALAMYAQLRLEFGWEAYEKVFAEYRDLPADQRPKEEMQKRDQWMVRFSRAVGKNLGPFFTAWGIPTSDAARESIQDLPAWMPK